MTDAPRLLIVEDDVLLRCLLKHSFAEFGFEIAVAATGEEGMALLDAGSAQFQGLITDINLGATDGWAVARHARALRPDMPVVYMSGESGGDWGVRGVARSAMVPKPFMPDQIAEALAALLDG